MEISIERSPQHWCPNEGSNLKHFAHKNYAVTARPQLHMKFLIFHTFFYFAVSFLIFAMGNDHFELAWEYLPEGHKLLNVKKVRVMYLS